MIVEYSDDVIYLSGDLTQDHWNTIRTAISLLLKRHPNGVIIDLSQIERCTPEGAETFLPLLDYLEKGQARVLLVNAPEHVKEALSGVPGVHSQLPVANSIVEARASLGMNPEVKGKPGKMVDPILILLAGANADEDAIELAATIARQRSTGLVLAQIIEVPRSMPLTAPLPGEEADAKRILSAAEGYAKKHGLTSKSVIERERERADGLAKMAEAMESQLVIYVVAPNESESFGQSIEALMHSLTQELIIYRGPVPHR